MESAYEGFRAALENLHFKDAQVDVYCNVTAEAEREGEKLKELVLKQLISPVRWTQTLQNMKKMEPGSSRKSVPVPSCRDLSSVLWIRLKLTVINNNQIKQWI